MILLIEDDATTGPALRRLSAKAFPEQKVRLASNGLAGVELAWQHARELRLIVLDINMPLLDGRLVAAELRAIAPQVPVMPFTGDETRLPLLTALGCVNPAIKGRVQLRDVPRQMHIAMNATVPPFDENDWVAALRQSAQAVIQFARTTLLGTTPVIDSDVGIPRQQVEQMIVKLGRVYERLPSRELEHTIRTLETALL